MHGNLLPEKVKFLTLEKYLTVLYWWPVKACRAQMGCVSFIDDGLLNHDGPLKPTLMEQASAL